MVEKDTEVLEEIDEERLNFVRFWAKYVRKTSTMEWSKQQKILIDSVLKNVNQDKELYLKTKEIARELLEKTNQESSSRE